MIELQEKFLKWKKDIDKTKYIACVIDSECHTFAMENLQDDDFICIRELIKDWVDASKIADIGEFLDISDLKYRGISFIKGNVSGLDGSFTLKYSSMDKYDDFYNQKSKEIMDKIEEENKKD